jgi:hypothetical protein
LVEPAVGACIEQHPDAGHALAEIRHAVLIDVIKDEIADAHEVRQITAAEAKVDGEIGVGVIERSPGRPDSRSQCPHHSGSVP